jgi:hypothetical protein
VINDLNLRELEMPRRTYTWANALPNRTYEKLDRILMSTKWEQKFPLSNVVALARNMLDHTPLLLDSKTHHIKYNSTHVQIQIGLVT